MSRRAVYISAVVAVAIIAAMAFESAGSKPVTETQPVAIITATSGPLIIGKEISLGDVSKKEVIFTFDGGGSTDSSDQILKALTNHKIKGTFFLTGKMVEAHPDFVKQIIAGGGEIFNHTYDHQNLTKLPDDKIIGELNGMEKVLKAAGGVSPKPYFRAPYGARDIRVLAAAARAGYQSVYWTVDARDWMKSKGETAAGVKARILSRLAPGVIYLMHVGDTITGSILDEVFTEIESKGYKIVSLTQGI